MTARTLPLALAIPLNSGSDPDVIEVEDCSEAVGDFPDIGLPLCDSPDAPTGQCQFDATRDHERCIHCGKFTG